MVLKSNILQLYIYLGTMHLLYLWLAPKEIYLNLHLKFWLIPIMMSFVCRLQYSTRVQAKNLGFNFFPRNDQSKFCQDLYIKRSPKFEQVSKKSTDPLDVATNDYILVFRWIVLFWYFRFLLVNNSRLVLFSNTQRKKNYQKCIIHRKIRVATSTILAYP